MNDKTRSGHPGHRPVPGIGAQSDTPKAHDSKPHEAHDAKSSEEHHAPDTPDRDEVVNDHTSGVPHSDRYASETAAGRVGGHQPPEHKQD